MVVMFSAHKGKVAHLNFELKIQILIDIDIKSTGLPLFAFYRKGPRVHKTTQNQFACICSRAHLKPTIQ